VRPLFAAVHGTRSAAGLATIERVARATAVLGEAADERTRRLGSTGLGTQLYGRWNGQMFG